MVWTLEVGLRTGDYERDLEASLSHCLDPQGVTFFYSVIINRRDVCECDG
jgi:hypothetical protein